MNRLPLGFSEGDISPKNRIAHHFKPSNISETRSSTGEFLPPKIQPSTTNSESETIFRLIRRLKRVTSHIPMFIDEARKLTKDTTKVWQSCDIEDIAQKEGIDFLHLKDNGALVVTVIRAGTKSKKEVHIEENLIPAIWARLNAGVYWTEQVGSNSWDNSNGDRDGNSFSFSRSLDLGFGKKVLWSGKYKNNDLQVEMIEHNLEVV